MIKTPRFKLHVMCVFVIPCLRGDLQYIWPLRSQRLTIDKELQWSMKSIKYGDLMFIPEIINDPNIKFYDQEQVQTTPEPEPAPEQ